MKWFKDGFRTVLFLAVATVSSYLFYHYTQNTTNVTICYLFAIVLISRYTSGFFWGFLASFLGVAGVNYLFSAPYMQLDFTENGYPITFAGMLGISFFTSALTAHLKEKQQQLQSKEYILTELYSINQKLIQSNQTGQMARIALEDISAFTRCSTAFYLGDPGDGVVVYQLAGGRESNPFSSEMVHTYAGQCYHQIQPVKMGQGDREGFQFFPVSTVNAILGVAVVMEEEPIAPDQRKLLELILSQVAMALERQQLSDNHHQIMLESEKEKMRANLLRAVSHDLRTPLTAIIGASTAYLDTKDILEEPERDALIANIREDSNWLLNMVENLLTVTRIQTETTKVKKTLEPLEEVLSEAIVRVRKRYPTFEVQVSIPEELIMAPMDAILIEQVLINLMENALKHGKSRKPVELTATILENFIQVSVKDFGSGIQEDKLKRLFDGQMKSFGESSDSSRGMGIGLSICKTIVKAHGGEITAQNHGHGATVSFTLPLSDSGERE